MPDVASATTTSCPASAAARATASPITPAPTTRICIAPLPCSGLDRQPDIVLRKRARGSLRARHIVELGQLPLAIERVVGRIEVKQLGHPPGETLRLPHPAQ